MNPFLIIAILIPMVMVAALIAAIPAFRLKQEEFKKTGQHPKGYYLGMGFALGLPLGIPIGLAVGNIALGPAFGAAIGTAIGAAMEKKHEHELRPLSEAEKKMQQRGMMLSLGLLVIGLLVFTAIFFLSR